MLNALLLSNSRGPDGAYLKHALDAIREFTPSGGTATTQAAFVPFAGVTMTWDDFANMVASALSPANIALRSLHMATTAAEQQAVLAWADLIVVGGGNTFQLLAQCRKRGLLQPIAQAARVGKRYLGWSAGVNLACPTICTTNDMPIVDPEGFDAIGLIDFQINPHYTNALPEGHRGETRSERIAEFLVANPRITVLGLPEGDWLRAKGGEIRLHGPIDAVLFRAGAEPQALRPGSIVPGSPR